MRIRGEGTIPSRIMIVGEFPTDRDEFSGQPFQGPGGQELNRMLAEAGIMRSECYMTYVAKVRPAEGLITSFVAKAKKDITPLHSQLRDKWVTKEVIEGYAELLQEIEMVQPNLIVACGNLAAWALTGKWGVAKWRGSLLHYAPTVGQLFDLKEGRVLFPKVIPTLTPASVQRQWETRGLMVNDLRRAKRHMHSRVYDNRPEWKFIVRPTEQQALRALTEIYYLLEAGPTWLDFDIETATGHIDSIGISWSKTEAICIPFMSRHSKEGYWSLEVEATLVYCLYVILTHYNARVRWQNGLYDAQYIFRHFHFIPRGAQDTMITQHSCFAALPKGLGFLGSMYADWYVYWKDEGKIASHEPEEQRWTYNLQDCVYTREVGEVLTETAAKLGLAAIDAQQQELFHPVLKAMIKGVRVRNEIKGTMAMEIQEELSKREAFLFQVLGHSINVASPKQMQALFYEDLKQPVILKRRVVGNRVIMSPTCDDEALQKIAIREPLLKPLTNAIADIRTLGKFLNDFVLMPVDEDGRMRCSYNIAGDAGGKSAPYSYRLSSGKNAFGSGGNLQTIPSEKSKSSGKAAARGSMDFTLPNIRSMYGPDAGFTFFDMDLDRADLQVVAWEADDPLLKAALKMGADVHLLNVYGIDGKEPPPLEELVESHPKYRDHRGPRKHKREFAKVFCHATDYLGKARTVAAHTGRSVHEIDLAQKAYFARYPGIQRWQERVIDQVRRFRFVENKFGYRWYIFDRIEDSLMPEAVAWIPQSTVGIVINKVWLNFHRHIPEVQVLLQVHDSLAGQFPTHRKETIMPLMREHSQVVIPYEDPLIIPTGVKTSTVSWGDCE